MRIRQYIIVAATIFWMGFAGLQAQEALTSSCGNIVANGQGSISYSVGQLFYTINTGSTGTVAEGVQQPWEISTVTGTKDLSDIRLSVSAYPNPVNDYLVFETAGNDITNLKLQLINSNGALIETIIPSDNKTTITVNQLVPATYYLVVTGNDKELKVFKIIKTGRTD